MREDLLTKASLKIQVNTNSQCISQNWKLGKGKKIVFMLISMKLWINLPGKAAETGNSQCFKMGFNHIMQGFINQRIAEDRKPSLCYRFLSCQCSNTAKTITIKKNPHTYTVLSLCIRISFVYLPRAKKFCPPLTHHLFSKLFFSCPKSCEVKSRVSFSIQLYCPKSDPIDCLQLETGCQQHVPACLPKFSSQVQGQQFPFTSLRLSQTISAPAEKSKKLSQKKKNH